MSHLPPCYPSEGWGPAEISARTVRDQFRMDAILRWHDEGEWRPWT